MKKTQYQRVFTRKNNNDHYFFGYYGISPWSKNQKYIIGLRVNFIDRHPASKDKAVIVIKEIKTGEIMNLAETRAWNWQQGCMLQWMPPDYNEKIIFNDRRNGKFVSVIYNIKKNKEEKVLSMPVYSLHPSGDYALSLNFARLNSTRKGYGYGGIEDKFKTLNVPEKEGVFLINLKTSKSKLLVSLKQLYEINYLSSMKNGMHWIDQPTFSPDGKRFCFLHRWYINNELFHTRFFTADLNGKALFMFPDSGFYSHFTWKNPNEILVWGSVKEKFRTIRTGNKKSNFLLKNILPIYRKLTPKWLRKKIVPAAYYLIEDKTLRIKKIKIHDEDGHPSFSPNKRYLITDTYPDKKNYRKLILYDFKKNKRIILGKFYSLPDKRYFREMHAWKNYPNSSLRCDLHPRWNFQGDKICFDSVHEGFRGVYIINLENHFE